MKKSTLSFLLAPLAALTISTGVSKAQENISEKVGTLSFFVRDAENGYGIRSEINIHGNDTDYKLLSDESGHIVFNNKEGRYDVTFTAEDHSLLKTYFYIENGNTVNIQTHMDRVNRTPVTDLNLSGALIEGYVIDFATGMPMPGVSVSMGDQINTTSDEKGHYSIFSNEYSVINSTEDVAVRKSLTFSAQGYSSYIMQDLLLAPTKISLNITLQKGQGQETEKYLQHVLDGTQQDVDMYEKNVPSIDNDNSQSRSNNSMTTTSGCTIPTTIRVGTSCSCTSCSNVSVMSLQSYTETGIDNEWISSWQSNSLSAGSVAYRTYGAYYVNHPVKTNFDIASTTCNQVWSSGIYANCKAAAQATIGMVLTADGVHPARAEYSSENNGLGASSGASCGNCKSGTGSGYPCFSDNLCCGKSRFGHGRGMCQWGTQRWSQNGQNFSWIVSHYYTPGNMSVCGSTSSCASPSGFSVTSITANSATLNWGAVSGATSYNVKYKPVSYTTWINTTSAVTSVTIGGLVSSLTYEFQVQAVCSNTGNFSASTTFTTSAAPILNDNCANAQSLTPNTTCVSTAGSVSGATAGGLAKSSCDVAATPSLKDVWYKFQATSTSHTVTITPSSGLDAVLSLYTSCSGGQLGCSDHGGGMGGIEKIAATGLTIGTTYYVRVYSYGSTTPSTSTFNICVTTPSMLISSIGEANDENKTNNASLILFPNPSDGRIVHGRISNEDGATGAYQNTNSMTVKIYDILGKTIVDRKIIVEGEEFTLSFDEEQLKPGVYIMFGITNDNRQYKKNIVVK